MKKMFLSAFLLLPLFMSGCLVGNRIVYNIVPNQGGKGTATVYYMNIRSDATDSQQFQEDQRLIFDYMLKSREFLKERRDKGQDITSRELYLENGQLNGKATYKFEKLSDVEKTLSYEDGFYFLTLALDDSVITTNGEIIKSSNYKRILWDDKVDTLKFEISIEPAQGTQLKDLAPLYKKGQ
ncbi:MAG: hypothetical protein HF314_06660 [Ignavibacteria bacterium]|jgi:hypothetical protein|nr:hypothetical protein [Ignavibacteria bacterium]MCU7502737.1 hypothetical protein [Ignavibacteria bacterium]MCU7517334.1 hypothetical protein [Ignavibacteria bacterium]